MNTTSDSTIYDGTYRLDVGRYAGLSTRSCMVLDNLGIKNREETIKALKDGTLSIKHSRGYGKSVRAEVCAWAGFADPNCNTKPLKIPTHDVVNALTNEASCVPKQSPPVTMRELAVSLKPVIVMLSSRGLTRSAILKWLNQKGYHLTEYHIGKIVNPNLP